MNFQVSLLDMLLNVFKLDAFLGSMIDIPMIIVKSLRGLLFNRCFDGGKELVRDNPSFGFV